MLGNPLGMEKFVMSVNKEFGPDFSKLSQKGICSLLFHLALVEDPSARQGSLHMYQGYLT